MKSTEQSSSDSSDTSSQLYFSAEDCGDETSLDRSATASHRCEAVDDTLENFEEHLVRRMKTVRFTDPCDGESSQSPRLRPQHTSTPIARRGILKAPSSIRQRGSNAGEPAESSSSPETDRQAAATETNWFASGYVLNMEKIAEMTKRSQIASEEAEELYRKRYGFLAHCQPAAKKRIGLRL